MTGRRAAEPTPLGRRPLPARAAEVPGSGAAASRPGRVLVVEDDYFVALASEGALADAGFEVVGVAASAEEAVGMAEAERPDLVLMDIRLAGERDGIAAAEEILARFGIRCVLATAHSDLATRQQGEDRARPLAWLTKPYAAQEVVAVTRAALARLGGTRS